MRGKEQELNLWYFLFDQSKRVSLDAKNLVVYQQLSK